jgi:hypothetical protein
MTHIRIATTKPLVYQPKLDEQLTDVNETILKDAIQFIIEINITAFKNREYYPDLQLGLRVLDNIELSELVRVRGIEYVIVRGYYWSAHSNAQLTDSLTSLASDNNSHTDSQGDSQTNSLQTNTQGDGLADGLLQKLQPFEVDNELVKKFIMQHYEAKQRATT